MSMNAPSPLSADPERAGRWIFIGGLVLFTLLMFHGVLRPDRVLFTTDDNIGDLALRKSILPGAFRGAWYDGMLLGFPMAMSPSWTNVLLWRLPARWFGNWIHGFDLLLASLLFAAFLRRRGLAWPACAVGALAAFWVGSNFTLTYAGHIMKFGILFWAAAFLWLSDRAAETARPAWAILAGGAMGAMFLEQADVALFFAMALGAYILWALYREHGWQPGPWGKTLLPLLAAAGLIAAHPLWEGYRGAVQGIASVNQENPQQKWEFATQWSWPPEESIDFIAPGFMGWRSGEPSGPYWGRMGRSAEWEQTRQGFQNFKLETTYLGAIPFALALCALFGSTRRRDARFWMAVAVVTLLLSFGKYFPLYAAFYRLPLVSSIRNPNKFLQIFQLAIGVLAAFGLDQLLRGREPAEQMPARDG